MPAQLMAQADTDDAHFMGLALLQARLGQQAGEVPVGAVLVRDGQVLAAAHNAPRHLCDPTAHAEILALRMAAQATGNHRLEDCTLYVTLEPCAMCSGAVLQGRLSRLVYGAPEPRTGCAGSVLNLFQQPGLNHQTRLTPGVRAAECAELLQGFFQQRREQQRQQHQALREDALRTPEHCFAGLSVDPWPSRYISHLPSLAGLRLHYLDEGPANAHLTWLCLHGSPGWSYLWRRQIPVWLAAGHRVVAPDLIGFGRSDKLKKANAHQWDWHRQVLGELVEHLNLQRVIVVTQGSQTLGQVLGSTLPLAAEQRYVGMLAIPAELSAAELAVCAAPFPDAGHQAAIHAFATMARLAPDGHMLELLHQAEDFWRRRGPDACLVAQSVDAESPGVDAAQQALSHFVRLDSTKLQAPAADNQV